MKVFVLVVLALVGYAAADCGCLKCSKHLTVGGEIVTNPENGPIKVIYRCEDGGLCHHQLNNRPLHITVQAPIPIPEGPIPTQGGCGGRMYRYKVQETNKPVYPFYDNVGYAYPIKVQAPIPVPSDVTAGTGGIGDLGVSGLPRSNGGLGVPLVGLKTRLDRVVVPPPVLGGPFPGLYPYGLGPAYMDTADGKGKYEYPVLKTLDCYSRPCRYHQLNSDSLLRPALCHSRPKRQLPFLDHSYKFVMNMLPKFIQEPIKHTVNTIALTHPDKKLQKLYNKPPPLTLSEKIALEHQKNVQKLRSKLIGIKQLQPVDNHLMRQHTDAFLESLQEPVPKLKKHVQKFKARGNEYSEEDDKDWLKELTVKEIMDSDFKTKKVKQKMSPKEEAQFFHKLKLLNGGNRYKRSLPHPRDKRATIIIDSDELDLPYYQVKLKDTPDENNSVGDDDNDYEDGNLISEETILRKSTPDSREEILRRAVRKELKAFRRIHSEEEQKSPFYYNKMPPRSPVVHLLSLPGKMISDFKNFHKKAFPVVGSLPKIIVGTKRYFKDFGKNLKKNVLHFASDVIGDFDHAPRHENFLDQIINPLSRNKRNIKELGEGKRLEQYEPDYSLVFQNENFRNVTGNKVRKKRYIVKIVNEDDIEQILTEKFRKLLYNSEETSQPERRYEYKVREDSIEDASPDVLRSTNYERRRRKKKQSNDLIHDKNVVVEKVKPRIIIDNNGLPFMEIDGYKRPIILKKKRMKKKNPEKSSYTHYDSSEEVNWEKIDHIVGNAHNYKHESREMPLQTLKEKTSQLLYETDGLLHVNCEEFDEIFDDLLEIQFIKNAIIQDWKRIVMEKRTNDRSSKVALLERFKDLQHIKDIALKSIIHTMYEYQDNTFVVRKLINILIRLHKLQCIINQVVGCFEEKFKTGAKFIVEKEIKFVDYLASLNFAKAKTRNDIVRMLTQEKDNQLHDNIKLIDTLKKLMMDGDDEQIAEQANLLWEIKNIEKMQRDCIDEMYQRFGEGLKIKKNLKVLFDLAKRLDDCEEKQKKLYEEPPEESDEDTVEEKSGETSTTTPKKFDVKDWKKKWEEKLANQKETMQKRIFLYKAKLKEKKNHIGDDENE